MESATAQLPQVDSIGIIFRYAQFHSAFLDKVLRCASGHAIDPREPIVRLTRLDRVNAPDELVERLTSDIAAERKGAVARSTSASPARPHAAPAPNLAEADACGRRSGCGSRRTLDARVGLNLVQIGVPAAPPEPRR